MVVVRTLADFCPASIRIGGVGYTPDMLREQIAELKGYLTDKSAPFGVDLLLPQVGGSARKTK